MSRQVFNICELPDLTMVKYSAEENSSVEDVLKQQELFYRQLNKRGLLFQESYRFIVSYVPDGNPGKRIHIWLEVISENDCELSLVNQLMASPLATYYGIKHLRYETAEDYDQTSEGHNHFNEKHRNSSKEERKIAAAFENDCKQIDSAQYRAWLVKQGEKIQCRNNDELYMVDEWKMNDSARLINIYKFMKALNQPCQYVVELTPVDYAKKARKDFGFLMQQIRNMVNNLDRNRRDENAEAVLKQYSKFLESLRRNVHFTCKISACSHSLAASKMLLDIAASEAVEEGGYQILENDRIIDDDAPSGMGWWRTVFILKEIAPFIALPALYPGETIEVPKETAPDHEKDTNKRCIYLGDELLSNDEIGYPVWISLESLNKHAFLAGVPGSGKTRSMEHLIYQLSLPDNNVPFVVLEPAKKEYRALIGTPAKFIRDITVFSPGGLGSFMLRINPFEFPVGMPLSEHRTYLEQVFAGAFDLLDGPYPMLLSESIEEIYRQKGWFADSINEGKLPYPTMSMLYQQLAIVLEDKYAGEMKENLRSVLEVRIGSLLRGDIGNVFDVSVSTLKPEEWMNRKCIIELEALGQEGASFFTLLLCTLIREYLRYHPKDLSRQLRHVIFIEEAHNVIGPTTMPGGENGNSKVASTKFIVDMLAEVRALKEGIIIADQLPTALADQVTKNTALKIAHKMTAMDDRQVLGATMSMDSVQMEQMSFFTPGQSLCIYDGAKKPFKLKIVNCVEQEHVPEEEPDNEQLYDLLADRECYISDMRRDWSIMIEKLTENANEHFTLVKRYADAYTSAEWAKKNNEKNGKSTLAEQQKMNQSLPACIRQMNYIQEDIVRYASYLKRNRIMVAKYKDEVLQHWLPTKERWQKNLTTLQTYDNIANSSEGEEPMQITRQIFEEQSQIIFNLVGEI